MPGEIQVKRTSEVGAEGVEGVRGVRVRRLWSEADGAPTFALRLFEVEPGASTPFHAHPHEHEVYVLEGDLSLRMPAGDRPLRAADTVLVVPHEQHAFANTGTTVARFLCAVPLSGDCGFGTPKQ